MRGGSHRLIWIAAILLSASAQARELLGPEAGVLPYGMGRAYSAIADDWLALHYNPAGLAMVRKVELQLFDLKVASNRDVLQSFSNVKDLGKSSSGSIGSTLSKFAGKNITASANNISQITLPYFAAALSYDVQTNFNMENQVYPQTEMRYTKDLAFIFGGGLGFGKQKDFRIGTSLKFMKRTGGVKNVLVSDMLGNRTSVLKKFESSGSGIGGDFGMQYRLPTKGRIELLTSFVWHDIGQTAFGTSQQQDQPTRIEENLVAGIGVRFPIGGKKNRRLERRYGPTRSVNHLSFAFDYSHLNKPLSQEDFGKHTHVGVNLDLPILSIQMGLNQSYLTFGTSVDIDVIRLAFATYAEELGSYTGQKPDRRYVLSIGSGFGFRGL